MKPRTALVPGLLAWLAVATTTLPAAAQAQSVDQHFAPVPTPPDSGSYPEAVQQLIEEGYGHLAQVSGPEDDEHLDPAEEAFERALDLDSRAVHALNGLGIYELTKDEQWLVLLESVKKILNRDHISMAVKEFEKALEFDPDFHAARYNLALAYRQSRGAENYRRAAHELERLVREAPGFADASLLLAITYRDAGDLEAMAAMAESLPAGDAFPPAGRQLLLAYALVNTGHPEDGAAAYWKGVDVIDTDRAADLYWHDIRPIVSPETDAGFHALDVEKRAAYLQSFWQGLADEGLVSRDERLAEHYRRLHHVYENFRLDLPERRHYSSAAAYVPPWQTGFDDRGVIYLRHGKPDDIASYSGPEVEQNVSWKYARTGSEPLVFHFISDEDVQDFKLVRTLADAIISNATKMTGQTVLNQTCGSGGRCDRYDARIVIGEQGALRELYASRGHLDPYYDRASTKLDPQILEREESRLASDIAVATSTQSFSPEQSGSPLPYPVYPVPFRNPGGETTIAFYYGLPTSEVSVLARPGGGSEVDYRYQLLVSSPGVDEPLARQEDDVVVATAKPIPRDPGVMLPGVRSVKVEPGEYRYGMKVTDLNSGRSGAVQGSVTVADLSGAGLALSGIVLAGRIEPATDTANPFVRWGRLKVLTLASRMFRRSQPVYVYYEAYGLAGDASGAASYRTTYTLESRQPDRNVAVRFFSAVGELLTGGQEERAVTYSFERTQTEEIDPLLEYFSLDASESPAGEYILTVEIQDLVGGATVRRDVTLTLVE